MNGDGQAARRIAHLSGVGLLLALGVTYLVAGVYRNLIPVGPGLTNRAGTRVGNDFSFFYAGARLVRAGEPTAIYSEDKLNLAHGEVIGSAPPRYQWSYPPTAGIVLAPLAWLPPLAAYWGWVLSGVLVTAIALRAVLRAPVLALLIVPFPGTVQAMICNQTALLNTSVLAGAFATLRARPAVAAALLALLTYKPQAALLVPFALLGGRYVKGFVAWLATAVALAMLSLLAFGAHAWLLFITNANAQASYATSGRLPIERMPTPYACLLLNGVAPATALAIQGALALAAALAVFQVWRRSDRLSIRALALAAATPLASPYMYDYDLATLVVPFLLLLDERRLGTAVPDWVLADLWLAPLLVPLASQMTGWHPGPLLLGAVLAYGLRVAIAEERRS